MRLFVTRTLLMKKFIMLAISGDNYELNAWQKMLNDFQLTQKSYFKWFQLIHAIPKSLKLAVLNYKENCNQILAIENIFLKQLSIVLKK